MLASFDSYEWIDVTFVLAVAAAVGVSVARVVRVPRPLGQRLVEAPVSRPGEGAGGLALGALPCVAFRGLS